MDNFWDSFWDDRICDDKTVKCNTEKAMHIVNKLWMMPELIKLAKLEIGCGVAMHIRSLMNTCSEWGRNYIGIDGSEVAVKEAVRNGVNAICCNLAEFQNTHNGNKYDVFFAFDVIEHIVDLRSASESILSMSNSNAQFIGNIPLYHSEHGGFERKMDIRVLEDFVSDSGFSKLKHEIYGLHGFPYMWFEARRIG